MIIREFYLLMQNQYLLLDILIKLIITKLYSTINSTITVFRSIVLITKLFCLTLNENKSSYGVNDDGFRTHEFCSDSTLNAILNGLFLTR